MKIERRTIMDKVLTFMLILIILYCGMLVLKILKKEAIVVSGKNILKPIMSVETDKKEIAVTINAVWGTGNIYKILDVLDKYDAKGTFFVTGYWVNDRVDESFEIYSRGHEIGTLGNNHIHNTKISIEKNVEEIVEGVDKINTVLGIKTDLFRPPFGEYDNELLTIVADLGMYPILWDIDSNDWMEVSVEHEKEAVLNNKSLGNGSILLFHNDSKYTSTSLDEILGELQKEGYTFVRVGDLIKKESFKINNKGKQKNLKVKNSYVPTLN